MEERAGEREAGKPPHTAAQGSLQTRGMTVTGCDRSSASAP